MTLSSQLLMEEAILNPIEWAKVYVKLKVSIIGQRAPRARAY